MIFGYSGAVDLSGLAGDWSVGLLGEIGGVSGCCSG